MEEECGSDGIELLFCYLGDPLPPRAPRFADDTSWAVYCLGTKL